MLHIINRKFIQIIAIVLVFVVLSSRNSYAATMLGLPPDPAQGSVYTFCNSVYFGTYPFDMSPGEPNYSYFSNSYITANFPGSTYSWNQAFGDIPGLSYSGCRDITYGVIPATGNLSDSYSSVPNLDFQVNFRGKYRTAYSDFIEVDKIECVNTTNSPPCNGGIDVSQGQLKSPGVSYAVMDFVGHTTKQTRTWSTTQSITPLHITGETSGNTHVQTVHGSIPSSAFPSPGYYQLDHTITYMNQWTSTTDTTTAYSVIYYAPTPTPTPSRNPPIIQSLQVQNIDTLCNTNSNAGCLPNTTTPNPYFYKYSGRFNNDDGFSFYNRLRITLNAIGYDGSSTSIQKYYVGFYKKSLGQATDLPSLIQKVSSDPNNRNGFLVAYCRANCAADFGVAFTGSNYYLVFDARTGTWEDIGSGYPLVDSSGKLMFVAFKTLSAGSWRIKFGSDFGSQTMYTTGLVTDDLNPPQSTLQGDIQPSP